MKTLKSILKSLLNGRRPTGEARSAATPVDNEPDPSGSAKESGGDLTINNQTPAAPEPQRSVENEEPKIPSVPEGRTTNNNQLKPIDYERKTDEVPGHPCMDNPDARKDPRISEELAEAYERGLRDGRNSKIEETYFPTCDDGVPVFNGDISNPKSASDFFSIAKSLRS